MVNAKPVTLCSDCTEPFDPKEEVEPLYNCDSCGEVFGKSNGGGQGNRCNSCNKFAAQDGETHEGCNVSIEDANPGFQCGKCGDATESEKAATECCVEEPDPEPKPGDAPRAQKWTPEPFTAYIVLRDAYMEDVALRGGSPHYLDVAQKSKAYGIKNWTFRWNSLHWHHSPGPPSAYWHDGSGGAMHLSDRATVDEKGIIHTTRIVGWADIIHTNRGVKECEMLLKPITQEELRVWKKGHEDRECERMLKEREKEKRKVKHR